MSFDFFPNEQYSARVNAARNPSLTPEPGVWEGFASGAANYTMRSLAEAGRAVDMAGAVFPIAADAVTGGTERQDQYFKEHDEVFNRAVDYWTPRPGEVGAAGQIAGQLAGGVMQTLISPALMVGTTQLSTAEDLSREGVDSTTANLVGTIQGASMAVGIKLPYLGNTLTSRVLSGVGGNLAQGIAGAAGSAELLKAKGYDQQAERFNPWDVRARVLDVMLGAAFGGLAHIESKVSATDQAALLVANQARHMDDTTSPGRAATDADATLHAEAIKRAMDQVLRGEPVTVDDITQRMNMVPDEAQTAERLDMAQEAARVAAEEAPVHAPIFTPMDTNPLAEGLPKEVNAAGVKARQMATDMPDMLIPSDAVDAEGARIHIRAADAIALADAEATYARNTAVDLFKVAANCLLGAH